MTVCGSPVRGNGWDEFDGLEPDTPPLVSVIVAHFEQQVDLDRTLRALSRQDHPADRVEIIVVDDGSRRTPVVPAGVRLVVQEDRGFRLAAARNAGAAVATGSVLCFLDADTAPEPAYVREVSRLPALAPDVVAVGRRRHAHLDRLAPDAPLEEAAPGVELAEPRWLVDAYRRSRNLLDADDRSYRHVIGAVTACSRVLFDATGGFDESFTEYGGEDWEWAYRAWLAGCAFAHVPAAVAWHNGPEWNERESSDRQISKNRETVRLASRIAVPGSAGRGVRPASPDVVVHWRADGASEGMRFVSLDSVLADLPGSVVYDEDAAAAWFSPPRIVVDVLAPIVVERGSLEQVFDELFDGDVGEATIIDGSGPLLRMSTTRSRVREHRWGRHDLFVRETVTVPGVSRQVHEPDVEAYLGGWA